MGKKRPIRDNSKPIEITTEPPTRLFFNMLGAKKLKDRKVAEASVFGHTHYKTLKFNETTSHKAATESILSILEEVGLFDS